MKTVGDVDEQVDDFYNPHSDTRAALRRAEKTAETTGNRGRGSSDVAGAVLGENESSGNGFVKKIDPPVMHNGAPAKIKQLFTSKKLRGKSSLITVLLLLFGGGGFLTIFFTPSLVLVQMKEVFTQSLNDQLHAVDSRSASVMRAKMKTVTKGSCGVVKIKCKFATMSDTQVKNFEKNNSGVKITRNMEKGFGSSRGAVEKITFTDDTGAVKEITSAEQLTQELKENPKFKSVWSKGYNPKFAALSDSVVKKVLRNAKASKAGAPKGNTDEERQKSLNDTVGGLEETNSQTLRTVKDKDGNDVVVDEDGNPVNADQQKAMTEQSDRISGYEKAGGVMGTLNAVGKGVNVVGAVDTSCTVFNTARFVSALAKVKKKYQAIRFALAAILTPADMIKSGDADEGTVNYLGSLAMATEPDTQVLDESKITEAGSASNPPMIKNPEAGGSAPDSPGYKSDAYGDVPKLNTRASRFKLGGGGPTAILDGVITGFARVINGGDPNPKQVSKKCKYVQNPAVRIGGFALGIIAGIGSFGIWTAVQMAGSVAASLALPLMESEIADTMAGNSFKDLSKMDFGDGGHVGSAAFLGDIAENRGMEPVTTDKIPDAMKYLGENKQANEEHNQQESYLARATPFDINNRFSFLGSIRFAVLPAIQSSKTSASMAMMNMASMIPMSFTNALQPSAGAASVSDAYFRSCNDQMYQASGIAAGPFCEVRHWMSDKEMSMDSLDNAQWMADSGNIDPDSDTGEAKDNSQPWNYVKYLDECAHRTSGWGEDQEENSGDGTECYSPENQELNEHFRVYTMDLSVNNSMDEEDQPAAPGTAGSADASKGVVGPNGWVFPTSAADMITGGYKTTNRPDHKGVDIAGKSAAETTNQPIYAAFDGVVTAAGPAEGYGNRIIIEHTVNGKKMSTVYGNMDETGVLVTVGTPVTAGQQIGKIGSAGGINGPHLHFELWEGSPQSGGTIIDPTSVIEGSRVPATKVSV
jgi:murein DD-endopeptidase MepM/ murein hydrolase activator NlpD